MEIVTGEFCALLGPLVVPPVGGAGSPLNTARAIVTGITTTAAAAAIQAAGPSFGLGVFGLLGGLLLNDDARDQGVGAAFASTVGRPRGRLHPDAQHRNPRQIRAQFRLPLKVGVLDVHLAPIGR